jgi:MFS family permease
VLAPLAALGTAPLLALLGHGSWLPPALFAALFAFLGAARTGLDAGGFNFLLDLAPHDDRPIYIGLTNTVVGLATLLTAAGGLIVHFAGPRALFVIAALLYLGGGACLLRTHEPRQQE